MKLDEALERGDNWYAEHKVHVNKVVLDEYKARQSHAIPAIEPSGEDFRNPALWKAIHWAWYFERRGI